LSNPLFNIFLRSGTIKGGLKFDVTFKLTWSYRLNRSKHCGKCKSYISHKEAFSEAGVADPMDRLE